MHRSSRWFLFLLLLPLAFLGCDSESAADQESGARGGDRSAARGGSTGGGRGGFGFGGGPPQTTAIPVDVAVVVRRDIRDFLETNGTLEAENEVDIVSRTSGPIVELRVEEGALVKKGQLLARIDADEIQAQLGIARVNLEEARSNLNRAKVSLENELISQQVFDQTQAAYDSAAAQITGNEIQLSYTEIRAPFSGLIIERAVKFAEFVNNGARLFRISDFDPLLCPIQIPEKDLSRVRVGQPAEITVESFPEDRFEAKVLRVNPVVDSSTGTVKVTLEVRGAGKLRPGMFASVYLQTDVHEQALVVPKEALVLESIGDSVYVVEGDAVSRRDVEVGYSETDAVEILSGVAEGERVVVVGQDALTQGTPVYVLSDQPADGGGPPGRPGTGQPPTGGQRPGSQGPGSQGPGAQSPGSQDPGSQASAEGGESQRGPRGGPGRGGGFRDIDWDDAEQVERVKGMMRERGLTDEQINERIEQMKSGDFTPPGGGRPRGAGGPPGAANL